VWIFDTGILTNLRTFKAGAVKYAFAVTRNGTRFDCTGRMSLAREQGMQTIILRALNNVWTEIVSEAGGVIMQDWRQRCGTGTPVVTSPAAPVNGDRCFTFERRQFCE
jgi:hypothetical protein